MANVVRKPSDVNFTKDELLWIRFQYESLSIKGPLTKTIVAKIDQLYPREAQATPNRGC